MKLLILGGTGFIGPHQVAAARAAGHTLTLFNRGRTNADLFPGVETLVGDRTAPDGYAALAGRTWDVVIDNPATEPSWMLGATRALRGRVGQYVYVSSTGVYADPERANVDGEDAATLPPAADDAGRDAGFGEKKTRCEQILRESMPDAATVVRPGLIVGPGDPTDRFTYWPLRVARGGEVLAPGDMNDPVQFVDARDLARFMLHLAETGTRGTFNVVGPTSPLGIAGLLYGAKACVETDARFTWVPQPFLAAQRVRSWVEMPVWSYAGAPTYVYCTSRIDRSLAAGFTVRPLADTVRDLLAWHATRPAERRERLRAGIAAEREREVLAAWARERGA